MFYSYPTKYVKILLTKQVIFVKTISETSNSYLLFYNYFYNRLFIVMKTGYFNQLKKTEIPGVISISLIPSGFDFVKFEFKALAPNWKLKELFRKNKIDEVFFIEQYNNQLELLNPKSTFDHLISLANGNEPILMTHGNKTKFCHRHLVAQWFLEKLGLDIEEYETGKVVRKNGYMKKMDNPTLFQ